MWNTKKMFEIKKGKANANQCSLSVYMCVCVVCLKVFVSILCIFDTPSCLWFGVDWFCKHRSFRKLQFLYCTNCIDRSNLWCVTLFAMFSRSYYKLYSVKPVYNDHPWDLKIVPVVDIWLLIRGCLCNKSSELLRYG
jgi:hypothetical protein